MLKRNVHKYQIRYSSFKPGNTLITSSESSSKGFDPISLCMKLKPRSKGWIRYTIFQVEVRNQKRLDRRVEVKFEKGSCNIKIFHL